MNVQTHSEMLGYTTMTTQQWARVEARMVEWWDWIRQCVWTPNAAQTDILCDTGHRCEMGS